MQPDAVPTTAVPLLLDRVLNGLSLFTLAMTVPQVVGVWSVRSGGGVSLWSWGAYLLSAIVWLVYGIQKRDRHIYLPCIGWILLDGAIVAGIVVNG
jgi:uncharacterized protein with PQ loop repeat